MVKLMIDQKAVEVPEGSTIMEAAENAGIPIPRLCFLKDINEFGDCRMCMSWRSRAGRSLSPPATTRWRMA